MVGKIVDQFAIFAIFSGEDFLEFEGWGIEGNSSVTPSFIISFLDIIARDFMDVVLENVRYGSEYLVSKGNVGAKPFPELVLVISVILLASYSRASPSAP